MQDLTQICVILDRSGSMQERASDHVGGLRSFVDDQKKLDGDVRFTLVQFDTENPCEIVYDAVPIEKVDHIELIPRGGTPLLDAVGKSLAHLEKRIGKQKPDQVVVMVITDGEENSSHEWSKAQVSARIKELGDKGWQFLFLAANIDAFAEAGSMGIAVASASGFSNTAVGTQSVYSTMSSKLMNNRQTVNIMKSAGASGQSVSSSLDYTFTDAERAAMSGTVDETNENEEIDVTDKVVNLQDFLSKI